MFISPPFKIVFMGTSLFAVPILNELAKSPDFKIVLVVTQPDKPRGRGQKPSSPPIKTLAQKLGIPVQQPSSLEKFSLPSATDLGLVVAYAKKIPTSLLTQPRCGFVNLHGSLLPKYQGASCIAMAILAGDKYSGITYLKMNEQIDKGDIIYQAKLPINPNDTAGTLAEKLSRLGAQTVTS
ncbi:methionyl-tRNA formyltransferase, partial [Candidatus Parcubacteria bacterium]